MRPGTVSREFQLSCRGVLSPFFGHFTGSAHHPRPEMLKKSQK